MSAIAALLQSVLRAASVAEHRLLVGGAITALDSIITMISDDAIMTREDVLAALQEARATLAGEMGVRPIEGDRCLGRGMIEYGCTMCGDSTYDHYCNDRTETCVDCAGTGVNPVVAGGLGR